MDFNVYISEISALLSRLNELQLPYPLSGNEVVSPKADIERVRAFCGTYNLAEDFVEFYSACDGISMNNVWNGYWIFGFERVKVADIHYIGEDSQRGVVELGSAGGGRHFAITADGSNTVFFLPSDGSVLNGVWTPMSDNSQPRIVAKGFTNFCLRLKEDVEAFVNGTPGWNYIGDWRE